jgi:hypothetical protein
VATFFLCRDRRNAYSRAPAGAKNREKCNANFNAITAAKLTKVKLAAEAEKPDLTEEQINAQIEEHTDDGISNVQAHVDVHPNHLFYINGAVSYRFFIEATCFLSERGMTDEVGEDSGPPLRTADGSLVSPTLFSTNLEICKPVLSAYIGGEVEKKIHQLSMHEDKNRLWKVLGAGSVGGTARNQPAPGRTSKYKIGITPCNAKNLRGCILNNKADRKVA